jgi:hypothetical protein
MKKKDWIDFFKKILPLQYRNRHFRNGRYGNRHFRNDHCGYNNY